MKDHWTDVLISPVAPGSNKTDSAGREKAISDLCRKTEEVFLAAGDHLSATSGALGQTRSVLAVFEDMSAKGTLAELRQHGGCPG